MRAWPKRITGRPRHHPFVDAGPQWFTYRDDGCELAPSCLRCPLPICKYDYPGGVLGLHSDMKREGIVASVRAKGVATTAEDFSVSERTVRRALERQVLVMEE